jgi:hypothetical protein
MNDMTYSRAKRQCRTVSAKGRLAEYIPCVRAAMLLVGGLLVFSPYLLATAVVALVDRASNRLVIAADCRVDRDTGSRLACKIVNEPGCVVAIAGLYTEKSSGFELRALVRRACNDPGNLQSKAERFVEAARAPYEAAIRRIREASPQEFARTTVNQPTEVIFAGVQDGQVALVVRGFIADSNARVTVERYDNVGPENSGLGYFLGLNKEIRAYVGVHPDWAKVGYPRAARQFVQMEIHAHPDLASPPISEVEIDSKGRVKWLSLGVCARQKAKHNHNN